VREWGFHDAAGDKAVDDLVAARFEEVRGQYEVVRGLAAAAPPSPTSWVTAKDALAPLSRQRVPVPFLQARPNNQFREGQARPIGRGCAWVDLETRYGAGLSRRAGQPLPAPCWHFDTGLIAEAEGRALSRPVAQGRDVGSLVYARPSAARQSLAAAPELDEPVARGAVPRTASARHARGRSKATSSRSRRRRSRAISPS